MALSLAFIALGFIENFKSHLLQSNLIQDPFAKQNLSAQVDWNGFEFLLGFLFLTGSSLIYIALRKKSFTKLILGSVLNVLFINLAILTLVPKIEGYTQNSAIEFYKSCAYRPNYIETRGFKSYAYLFYSNRKPNDYSNPDQIQFVENQLEDMENAVTNV